MEGITADSQLLENLRRQVLEYQERIDREEITEQEELDNYFALVKLFNRTKENASRTRATDTKSVEEVEIARMLQMNDWEFEQQDAQGKFDHLPDAAWFQRFQMVEAPEDRPPRPRKPCLCISDEPERPKLLIPI